MRVTRQVHRPVRVSRPGLNVAGGVDVTIAANVGEEAGSQQVTRTSSHTVIHQSRRRTRDGTTPTEEQA